MNLTRWHVSEGCSCWDSGCPSGRLLLAACACLHRAVHQLRHARRRTYFLRIEMNVLSFDPSFWCSSTSGASWADVSAGGAVAGGVAAGGVAADEDDVNAHIVQRRRASLGGAQRTAQGIRSGRSKEIPGKRCRFSGRVLPGRKKSDGSGLPEDVELWWPKDPRPDRSPA